MDAVEEIVIKESPMVQMARVQSKEVLKWLKGLSKQYPRGVNVPKSRIKTDFAIPNNRAVIIFQLLAREGYILKWCSIWIPPNEDLIIKQEKEQQEQQKEDQQKKDEADRIAEEEKLKNLQIEERARVAEHTELQKFRKEYFPVYEKLQVELDHQKGTTFFVCQGGSKADCDLCYRLEEGRCPHSEIVKRIFKLKKKMHIGTTDDIEADVPF